VIPVVDLVAETDDHPPPEPCVVDGGLQLTLMLADDDTPLGFTLPRPSTPLRGTTVTCATDVQQQISWKLSLLMSRRLF
jgi:hypothetical protein